MTVLRALSSCRSCDASIIWARTPDGQSMPLNPTPTPGGNVRLAGDTAIVIGSTIDLFDTDDDGVRYTPHFATCPQADLWRKPR